MFKGVKTSMLFDESFIKNIVPDVEFVSSVFPKDIRFCIDSRAVQKGDIFVAFAGERVDGHDFVGQAIKSGAAGLLVAHKNKSVLSSIDKKVLKSLLVVVTHDPKKAFISLAGAWRDGFDCPIVGITGSVGKTSTKEMLSNVLDLANVSHVSSHGNQNTLIGLSLNIFEMREHHKAAIFEMGIAKRGEMKELAKLVKPTHGIITEIGHSHMQGLGSLADIAYEKKQIFSYFKNNSIGVINGDQSILSNIAYAHPTVTFGTKMTNRIQARKIQIVDGKVRFILKICGEKFKVVMPTSNKASLYNALGAATAARLLEIPAEIIAKGVQKPIEVIGRFAEKPLKFVPGIMIDDCYNASPESMKAALLALEQMNTSSKKVAILGDMLELGINSPFWHRQLGRFLRKVPSLNKVVLVGKMVKWTKKTMPTGLDVHTVENWQEALDVIKENVRDESVLLVKGSRGIGLDNIVKSLT